MVFSTWNLFFPCGIIFWSNHFFFSIIILWLLIHRVDGTRGYVDACISKTLIDNINEVHVYLNENEMDYNVTSLEDSWLLHFTDDHSTHKVVISLNRASNSTTFDFLTTELLPLLLVVGLIVLCVIYVIFRKSKRKLNFET